MRLDNTTLTILHVEDDLTLARLVKSAFEGFGFRGTMIGADRVAQALDLLDERARNNEPVDLILVDMQLPDGLGLDVIREVKSDPVWQHVPVVVLSSAMSEGMLNGAYALGANCYVPKIARVKDSPTSLRSLYTYWLETALLPEHSRRDRLQDALERGGRLRARTSELYLRLARLYDAEPEEMGFWLDRSLNEGNLSNLLVFLRNSLSENDVSAETVDRLAGMQTRVRRALAAAEARLRSKPAPGSDDACRLVLDITGALDEEVFAEMLGCLFPKGPAATAALKARAAIQLRELAKHVLARVDDPGLCERAQALLDWGERLAAETNAAGTEFP